MKFCVSLSFSCQKNEIIQLLCVFSWERVIIVLFSTSKRSNINPRLSLFLSCKLFGITVFKRPDLDVCEIVLISYMNTSSGFRWQRRFKKNTSFSAHLSEVQVLSFFDSILLLQIIRVTANCENDLESVHVSTQFSSRRIKIYNLLEAIKSKIWL